MTRLEEQSRVREENARYLTQQLREVPGILPARMHEGCTRNAYHLYMFRYQPEPFAGLPRARFLEALRAEGVPCSAGYTPLNRQPFVAATLASRAYQRLYPKEVLALGGAQPLPDQRAALRGSGLADANDAPRAEAGHGRHRRRDPQDPRLGRRAGESVRTEEVR
jgi:hypothetical protein